MTRQLTMPYWGILRLPYRIGSKLGKHLHRFGRYIYRMHYKQKYLASLPPPPPPPPSPEQKKLAVQQLKIARQAVEEISKKRKLDDVVDLFLPAHKALKKSRELDPNASYGIPVEEDKKIIGHITLTHDNIAATLHHLEAIYYKNIAEANFEDLAYQSKYDAKLTRKSIRERLQEALKHINTAIRLNDLASYYALKADIQHSLERYVDARDTIEIAFNKDPDDLDIIRIRNKIL